MTTAEKYSHQHWEIFAQPIQKLLSKKPKLFSFFYLLYLFRFYKNTKKYKIHLYYKNITQKFIKLKEKKNYKFSKINIEATPTSPQHPRRKPSPHH